ncbi:tetR/AcrR family transcriptional regulator [Streptococcus sanguinis]|nr:tetR/AcrR family transcriptional regulator [Streptococcus sanguinis]
MVKEAIRTANLSKRYGTKNVDSRHNFFNHPIVYQMMICYRLFRQFSYE